MHSMSYAYSLKDTFTVQTATFACDDPTTPSTEYGDDVIIQLQCYPGGDCTIGVGDYTFTESFLHVLSKKLAKFKKAITAYDQA